MSDNIKVVVKVRPLISREIEEKLSYQWRVSNNTLYQLDQNGKDNGQSFTFDKVYDKDTKTSDVYNDIAKPIVEAATAGFNGTIFAYGQTSSGKTYTMTGTENSSGIIQLAVLNLFDIIQNIPDRDFLVRVSYIEIYNETVKDLLNVEKETIKIHETLQGIRVDAKEKVTSSPQEVLEAMKEGEANRQKGATNMNEESSRSHSIFQITIESREHLEGESEGGCVNVSQLNLVDLAGSERAGQTGATGKRFKEGTHINKSLSALALVIKQLSEDPNKFTNYRDSKLTRILQNSLGGNAKTSIICAITPAAVEETISTLQFANRAKAIKNKPEVNAVATDKTMIQQLTRQMSKLQAQLESKKNLEHDNYKLQKQINSLQSLILNGFQRRSFDMIGGTRRKLQPPRRVTIHSTLSTIEDEHVVDVPRFCTPSLKYNPLSISSDLVASQSSNKLASVPEEPPRLKTPPPHKTVYFSGDVIELDSDDDSVHGDQETCSPIHKCYGSSKTPPCILRKNARKAEKDLKDIVELTEREKIYSPSAVELIEKLEENSMTITKLKDDIEMLNKQSKEKDLQLDALQGKIKKTEEEFQTVCSAKLDLQAQCDSFNTKLTDWEVSYETLKNKAKLREAELLSLLEEFKVKKTENIGKLSQTLDKENLLDTSKNISLVNSENENSVVTPDNSNGNKDIAISALEQLTAKNQYILEIESNVFAYKEKIESLERLTKELEQTTSTFKEKITNIESENSLLKSKICTLNTTIKNQDESLKLARNDIDSYNSLIQELQIKIRQNDNMLKISMDDSALENMISNEKQFIANNENMVNIIQCLRNAIHRKNKEIAELNTKYKEDKNVSSNHKDLSDQLQTKIQEIVKLNSELDDIKKKLNENICVISKLTHENSKFKIIEKDLSEKLNDIQSKNSELEKINCHQELHIQDLKSENDRLVVKLNERNSELTKEIELLTDKIYNLEITSTQKDDIINSLSNHKLESEENLLKAKSAVFKSQTILSALTGNIQEVPEIIDNFVNVFTVLSDSLNALETVASDIVLEKEETKKVNDKLRANLEQHETKSKPEIEMLQKQLNEIIDLQNLARLSSETKQKEFQQIIHEKDKEIASLRNSLEKLNSKQKEEHDIETSKYKEQLEKMHKEHSKALTKIYSRLMEIAKNVSEINNLEDEIEDNTVINEQILSTLDKVCNHITFINLKNVESDNNGIGEILKEAKREIVELSQNNFNLQEKISDVERKNSELLTEIEINENSNKKIDTNLTGTQLLLQDLQIELKAKSSEIASMERKVVQWKEKFQDLDVVMKQQMEEMKIENNNLKARIKAHAEIKLLGCPDHDSEYYDEVNNSKVCGLTTNSDINIPPSLVTICCNKIVDFMEPKESQSSTTTSSSMEIHKPQLRICMCTQLTSELITVREENSRIVDLLGQMEIINQSLLEEQDLLRGEIRLLLELAHELQKKISNHRTNLSILTATTYAENKSLKSQVKVLQHHHKRFHNVCQRDLPEFEKQLKGLMTLLRGDISLHELQSFKRYSLPNVLDSNTTLLPSENFKNDSTLDGDLLMLDTNITLATAADNTLISQDQTCLDMTQYYNGPCYQINADQNVQQINASMSENEHLVEQILNLKEDNAQLREIVRNYLEVKDHKIDSSAGQNEKSVDNDINKVHECVKCEQLKIIESSQDNIIENLNSLTEALHTIKLQKADIEEKYNNLIHEGPSTEALVKKLNVYEIESNRQKQEITKLNNIIHLQKMELRRLQEENDTLSNQVMDSISEADNLNKELKDLEQKNIELLGKCKLLEQTDCKFIDKELVNKVGRIESTCSQFIIKEELIETMQNKTTTSHAKLHRSLSDSDTSSRYNKICTLQSELHAGREDCKVLTEDVVTIKNHLERSNLSMDLDESVEDRNIYKDFEITNSQSNKCNMPDIPEERSLDIYLVDKLDCLNYYVEKTGAQKDHVKHDVKTIELMKMLYEYLVSTHVSEVENLTNKLKNFEETKIQLQDQCYKLGEKHIQIAKELEEKEKDYNNVAEKFTKITHNINIMNELLKRIPETDNANLVDIFKQNLPILDNELVLSSVKSFECLINHVVNKHHIDLSEISEKYTKLQDQVETVTGELNSVNNSLILMKTQLSAKENEYNLLKTQKERVHEITNAVTLDIVKREKELKDTIHKGYQTLIELDIVKPEKVNSEFPLNKNINGLFELLVFQKTNANVIKENEKATLSQEINTLKSMVKEKEKEIDQLKACCEKLQEINNSVTSDSVIKENELQQLQTAYDNLSETYKSHLEENNININKIEKLSEEIHIMKCNIVEKEKYIDTLEIEKNQNNENLSKIVELLETVKCLQEENTNLKSLNEMINKEKNTYAEELERTGEIIKKNNIDLDKMTSDILVLRESVKENGSVIENLRAEAKSLLVLNKELREQLETKSRECLRLETNIKTHEKTAQIQTRMIMRLEKQKNDENKLQIEAKQQLEEITLKYLTLQKQSDTSKLELEQITKNNEVLQSRVTELEASLADCKNRPPGEVTESTRRRRQSLQDSKRIPADDKPDIEDHNSTEIMFHSRPRPDDLFMDVDEDTSNRSTPIRLSKGRHSLSLSRDDHSDKDDEHSSRASSVMDTTRRRRQTLHDSHRGELSQTPTALEGSECSTVSQLKEQLAACQQELEELKERYKELDLECETCAEHFRERDEQCARLVREKRALQQTIEQLQEKLQSVSPNKSHQNAYKPNVAHAAVNTDEDWTNLHSVVVDRMSYDVEVEKNKKLTKTIEELRFQKQDLKTLVAKMQKALDKHRGSRELETTKLELQSCKRELESCKQELSQLKKSYKALDEECETCAQYLREREEQCHKLKEAKDALEAKLQEIQNDLNPKTLSTRKKRQTFHDQNRGATVDVNEASSQTTDDLLSYQVERDYSRPPTDDKQAKEVKHLKLAVERLLKQKEALEQQLKATAVQVPQAAMLVGTGSAIVQNQQITDIMKENQKLKKINAKLINVCKKRGKESNRENEDPGNQN